ncbi:PREDICTED: protein NRT1/ PTR FAMILY 2.13-like isoform X2 [Camelina sativa]|uniref:Protein NRT1/ PTR FAMILY 2.13-like isoform X1 n=1 Tax=Camelina sativa TaxID=90675 RepID=A0ABM1Q934_CAMSA|nr:PREDICTED: protein NRT1/ PTR FAMILY 2.13-like isoform X1 [Camelina sativa]XP_019083272.1 PREDICTED: protein NRT1/ PTR FAMILY 2.13-like isoform X2 [Camelina sativa]
MVLEDRKEDGSSLPQPSGSFSKSSPLELDVVDPSNQKTSPGTVLDGEKVEKKPGGWRAISFILGNETLERLGTIGLLANFMVYLTKVFHLEQVDASNVINIWSGFTNLTPLVGAFISDTYVGRFKTIAFASFATLLGLITITLTASLPQLHPASCNSKDPLSCAGPNKLQFGVLLLGLCFLSIGSGGIRPCSIPFGVDQFDQRTEEGVKGVASFFNWYYMTFTIVLLITQTVVVYIQDQVSWIIGFSIPTGLMALAVVMFFAGMKRYIYVKPEGSIFSGIAQVIVAARKKRKLKVPAEDDGTVTYYDPSNKSSVLSKLHRSNQFRFLDKAAVISEGDLTPEGAPADKWRLCSVQEVEEVKCLIRVVPVWSAGIISLAAMTTQGTFTVSQALKMDRHLGPNFEIPAGSLSVISLLTIGVFLPFYDRVFVPFMRRITGHKSGITLLQRIGTGIVFAIFSMIVAGIVERMRRRRSISAGDPTGMTPMSVFWLSPQLILMGLCEAFNIIGQIEFFNSQFPEHMRSIANSLFSLSFAGSNYLSSFLVTFVHKFSGGHDRPDWLNKNLNAGKLDYFYYLIAVLGVFNLVYFWYCARGYRYKVALQIGDFEEDKRSDDLEMTSTKPMK